jgi:hypothetical protein
MVCTKFHWKWPAASGEDFFFNIKHRNMVFPILAPPDPWGQWFVQTWIYMMSESFHVNMNSSGSVVCEKIFNNPTPFLHFCDYLPLEESWLLICTILNSVYLRMICTKFYWNWLAGSGEDFFFNVNTEKYGFSYCNPSRPSGTMLCTNLHLHHIRKLSSKYKIAKLTMCKTKS